MQGIEQRRDDNRAGKLKAQQVPAVQRWSGVGDPTGKGGMKVPEMTGKIVGNLLLKKSLER